MIPAIQTPMRSITPFLPASFESRIGEPGGGSARGGRSSSKKGGAKKGGAKKGGAKKGGAKKPSSNGGPKR